MLILQDHTNFSVNLNAEGFSDKELIKLENSRYHMEKALSSKEFFLFMANFTHREKKCTGRFWWKKCTNNIISGFHYNQDKSNKEIYNHLMCGAESLILERDSEADIFIKIDRRNNSRVLGYTYSNTSWQWIYIPFFNRGTQEDIAGNLAHEWCHKMGYQHEYRYTNLRQFSVPYAVGQFVKDFKE